METAGGCHNWEAVSPGGVCLSSKPSGVLEGKIECFSFVIALFAGDANLQQQGAFSLTITVLTCLGLTAAAASTQQIPVYMWCTPPGKPSGPMRRLRMAMGNAKPSAHTPKPWQPGKTRSYLSNVLSDNTSCLVLAIVRPFKTS